MFSIIKNKDNFHLLKIRYNFVSKDETGVRSLEGSLNLIRKKNSANESISLN